MERKIFVLKKNVLHFQVNLIPLNKTDLLYFKRKELAVGKLEKFGRREGTV